MSLLKTGQPALSTPNVLNQINDFGSGQSSAVPFFNKLLCNNEAV